MASKLSIFMAMILKHNKMIWRILSKKWQYINCLFSSAGDTNKKDQDIPHPSKYSLNTTFEYNSYKVITIVQHKFRTFFVLFQKESSKLKEIEFYSCTIQIITIFI